MQFFRRLLYQWWGWRKEVTVAHPDKFIIALAPHTSNWDFVLGMCYRFAEDIPINFLMKKEWFFWPLGPLFRRWGGIPVERSRKTSLTDTLACEAINRPTFRLCITPEGTRSAVTEWKRGFYYIALKARIPILLYGIDYERKLICCTRQIIPTGNYDADIQQIKDYFKNFKGKHPDGFAV